MSVTPPTPPTPLDAVILDAEFPFAGTSLIEASAGTGKTYCLQTLYLRLVVERGLTVQNILVVTFTEAATHELRDRLRVILEKCRLHLKGRMRAGDDDADRVAKICQLPLCGAPAATDANAARLCRVEQALLDVDEASIHTIHGFCHSVLRRHAFECGQAFDAEMVGKDDAILDDACQDLWRKEVYGDPEASTSEVFTRSALIASCMTLSQLRGLAGKVFDRPDAILSPAPEGEPAAATLPVLQAFLDEWSGERITASLVPLKKGRKLTKGEDGALRDLDRTQRTRILDSALWNALGTFAESILVNGDDSAIRPFLDGCKDLCAWRHRVRTTLAKAAVELARRRKAEANRLTFADLILNLRDALKDPQRGPALRETLRTEYKAALIDEFQDTDSVQYDIFRSLFIEGETHPVFLVGDPKQAIYAFRSGDVFTYYAAAQAAPRRYTLSTNYRSEKRLVEAANVLFKNRFQTGFIQFAGDLKAKGKAAGAALLVNGQPDPQPFRVWHYDIYDKKEIGSESPIFRTVYSDIATEIRRLLDDPDTKLKGRGVRPSDIAILVLKHAEADLLQRALAALRIPAVRQSTGKVFDAGEAADLQLLLEALAEPSRFSKLRAALATDLFDLSDAEIFAMLEGKGIRSAAPNGLRRIQDYVELFEEAHRLWRRHSVLHAFRHVSRLCRMRPHVLGLENGERRLTNLLQLLELVHQAAKERHLGIAGTVEWLARQKDKELREENDAFEGRLESDAQAVRIMTVFKSKGLQFPIVFVPTLGLRLPWIPDDHCAYHRAENGEWPLVLDVAKEQVEEAKNESRQENIRLFYVAATRAEHRTYLVWGKFRNPEKDLSPLSDVLRGSEIPAKQYTLDAERAACAAWLRDGGPVAFEAKPPRQSAAAAPVLTNPVLAAVPLQTHNQRAGLPLHVDKSHRHTSFSALEPERRKRPESAWDFDEPDETTAWRAGSDIFSFPAGAKTGKCWHAIFEQLDFTLLGDAAPGGEKRARATIDGILELYRLCTGRDEKEIRQKKDVVARMVRHVLRAPLANSASNETFRLCELKRADRCTELGFDFPLRRGGARRTALFVEVLRKHWGRDPERKMSLDALAHWDKELPQGFMNGSIDILFRVKQRYYIIDWKSNRRGGQAADFAPDGLRREMAENTYFLQYLIYTVATHQYLKGGLSGYDYERDFGGAFYIFLRGVDPAAPGRGIYFDRPPLALIEDLSSALGEFR